MSNKIHIEVNPLNNSIIAGKKLKTGAWAAGKQDVTIDSLIAVAKHVKTYSKSVEIRNADTGTLIFKITVD